VRICQNKDALQESIEAAQMLSKNQGGPEIEVNEWKKIGNAYNNNIKHFDSEVDRHVEIEAED
jgi:hypothetical protein